MRYLRSTVKWEMRRWKEYVLPYVLAVLVIWLVLWAMLAFAPARLPGNNGQYDDMAGVVSYALALALGILPMLAGAYMVTVYPTMSVVGFEFTQKSLPEHGSGRPFAVVLAVRMVIAVITCLAGIMIFSVTFYFLAGLGWDFAVSLATTPRCVFGDYGACRDYRGELCVCTRLSPFAFVMLDPIILRIMTELVAMVALLPGIILYVVAYNTAAGRGKAVWPYTVLLCVWCVAGFIGGPVWGLATGNQIPGYLLLISIISPIVFLIASCPLINRHSDKISVSQIGQGTWWGFK